MKTLRAFFVKSFCICLSAQLHCVTLVCTLLCSLYFSVRQGGGVRRRLWEVDVHLLTPHPALASVARCRPVSSDHGGKPPIIRHCSKEPIISHDYTSCPPPKMQFHLPTFKCIHPAGRMEGGKKDERGIAEKRWWLSTNGRIRGRIQMLVKSFVMTLSTLGCR